MEFDALIVAVTPCCCIVPEEEGKLLVFSLVFLFPVIDMVAVGCKGAFVGNEQQNPSLLYTVMDEDTGDEIVRRIRSTRN